MLVAGLEHSPVMVELCARELALDRLDASPFDPEPESVEAEAGQHCNVLLVPVVEVAGVAGGLFADGAFPVLPPPPIAVGVAALDLVRADGRTKKEAVREIVGHSRPI